MTHDISDCLSELYYLKKIILMLENIWGGLDKVEGRLVLYKSKHTKPKTIEELYSQINEFQKILRKEIDDTQYEEWFYSDYEAYTDEHHHRRYWNEIPNDNAVNYFLAIFTELTDTEMKNESCYELSLYDFNNESLYFSSETELNAFVETYECAPCTAFEKSGNSWTEMWSV